MTAAVILSFLLNIDNDLLQVDTYQLAFSLG